MTCQDVVERFHLCLSLLFVVAEEMDNSSTWVPSASLVWKCSQIFIAEVCIDVIKHAVLGKFNEIRPGVYREFLKVGPLHRAGFIVHLNAASNVGALCSIAAFMSSTPQERER